MWKSSILVWLSACAVPLLQARPSDNYNNGAGINIVGGTETEPHEHPSIVAIHRYGGFTTYHWCGGIILNENWVLTAGHCITRIDTESSFQIIAGDHDVKVDEGTEQKRGVQAIFRHPLYSDASAYKNDIALLKVTQPLTLNKYVQPAHLPPRRNYPVEGPTLAAGWGRLTSNGILPDRLMHVQLPLVVSDEACREVYGEDHVLDSMLCAMDPQGGRDSCRGDSGGPLYYYEKMNNNRGEQDEQLIEYVVGLTSWGLGCGSPGYPGVYTEVSYFIDWIQDIIDSN